MIRRLIRSSLIITPKLRPPLPSDCSLGFEESSLMPLRRSQTRTYGLLPVDRDATLAAYPTYVLVQGLR